jgi:co-chaperonin GroES (HSP10)
MTQTTSHALEAKYKKQVGYVLKMGPLCYGDKERYPTGPWCKEKDWVIFARYAGSRMEIDGGEIRMLNDDEVLGTIDDPKDLIHAM